MIPSGRHEGRQRPKLEKPGAAQLARSNGLNRERSFTWMFYFDADQQHRLSDRNSTMNAVESDSTSSSRASDSQASRTEWHSTAVSVGRITPAAEADEDLASFNFGDGANNAGAAPEGSE